MLERVALNFRARSLFNDTARRTEESADDHPGSDGGCGGFDERENGDVAMLPAPGARVAR